MVLRNRLFIILFIFVVTFLFPETPEYETSSLMQFGEWNDSLLLMRDRETIQIKPPPNFALAMGGWYSITSEYVIRNAGGECTARLGLLVAELKWGHTPSPEDFGFRINGTEIRPAAEPVEGSETRGRLYRLAVEIVFPAGEELAVQVQYMNSFRSKRHNGSYIGAICTINYNWSEIIGLSNLSKWKGEPELIVEMANESANELVLGRGGGGTNVERAWIADMEFLSAVPGGEGSFRMCYYLMGMNDARTDLVSLRREAGNRFTATFAREFVSRHGRDFRVSLMQWVHLSSYCTIYSPPHQSNVTLNIFPNTDRPAGLISERELGPYELFFLTARQLRVMRNAFYARHGYVFRSEDLQSFFFFELDQGKGYVPNPGFSESMLTDIDRANIRTIQRLEMMDRGP